ncbi:hypothetical protein [Sphaerospermopsis kisseleviana]|nr:hypothetical protein [Sphaerospermopsis kisseleviana]
MIDNIQDKLADFDQGLNKAEYSLLIGMIDSYRQRVDDLMELYQKITNYNKISDKFQAKKEQGELDIKLFVRLNFILKGILDKYLYFFIEDSDKESIKRMTLDAVKFYKKTEHFSVNRSDIKDENFLILETKKHLIQSLIKASLQIKALSEEEINAFNLGDITPQESEAMLISLASTKKWDYVYRKLA